MAHSLPVRFASRLRRAALALHAALFVALALLVAACGARPASRAGAPPPHAEASAPATAAPRWSAGVGFRSPQLLAEHFAKHGGDFGAASAAEYLRMAQALRDAPVGGSVQELVRPDGTASRYDAATGAFLAFNPDGTIRTFFKPRDGLRYFRRQAERSYRGS